MSAASSATALSSMRTTGLPLRLRFLAAPALALLLLATLAFVLMRESQEQNNLLRQISKDLSAYDRYAAAMLNLTEQHLNLRRELSRTTSSAEYAERTSKRISEIDLALMDLSKSLSINGLNVNDNLNQTIGQLYPQISAYRLAMIQTVETIGRNRSLALEQLARLDERYRILSRAYTMVLDKERSDIVRSGGDRSRKIESRSQLAIVLIGFAAALLVLLTWRMLHEVDRTQQRSLARVTELERELAIRNIELTATNSRVEYEARERQLNEERANFLSLHDTLTGLPNRRLLSDRLKAAFLQGRRESWKVAVLFIDLDRFKSINESLGYAVGDEVLCEVARRIQSNLRQSDTVSRIGSDQFAVVLPNIDTPANISMVTNKLLMALGQPIHQNGHDIRLTCSIGISVYPDDGSDAERLLCNAEAAMNFIKSSNRDDYQFYAATMNESVRKRHRLELGLHKALENNAFRLYYQPRIDLATNTICSYEALLRWQHPEDGLVRPDLFIPIAEETGLIVPIGEWVLLEACQQLLRWDAQGRRVRGVSVNLSARQFADPNLVERVERVLNLTGIDPTRLDLEVTESIMLKNSDQTQQVFDDLKKLGVQLSLDDFGTGYSSLSYLTRFRVNNLKIDRSFVREIGNNSEAEAVVKAVIGLAKSLQLRIVAEGVELREHRDFLIANGCEEAQGYLFSPPQPPEKVIFSLDHLRLTASTESASNVTPLVPRSQATA